MDNPGLGVYDDLGRIAMDLDLSLLKLEILRPSISG